MALTYTSTVAISRRLRGRLQIGGVASPFGETVIDDDLITQIGEQVEARVDNKLRQIYEFPLASSSHPELASVVEKLAIAELVPVHFVGNDSDQISNYGQLMHDQGKRELEAIASGDVQLAGETPIYAPRSIVPNRTVTKARTSTLAKRKAGYSQETKRFKPGDQIDQIQSDSVKW